MEIGRIELGNWRKDNMDAPHHISNRQPLYPLTVKIKYHTDITKLQSIGNWIDMRSAQDVELKQGEYYKISLGVSMKLPEGFEGHVAPRSSTFSNWGILQTNGVGIIDDSYMGNNDVWSMGVYATRDATIKKNDRICQFRIMKIQPPFTFEEVDNLDGEDRGGFGKTGIK